MVNADPFNNMPGAEDYMKAVFRALERGESGIHHRDAFEIAIKNGYPPSISTALCFLAKVRVEDMLEDIELAPYDTPEVLYV